MSAARVAAEKAAIVFEHFGWEWSVKEGQTVEPFVPSVDEIEAGFERLTESIYYDRETVSASSGRLRVDRDDVDNGLGTRYYLDLAETNPYTGEVMG